MPDLPNEIWFCIAKHLSDEEIERLLALNRVFLELALNTRYKEVKLGCWSSEEYEKRIPELFKHLSMPHISSRIQRIILHLQPGLLEAPNSSDNFQALVERVLDHFRPGRGRDRRLLRTSRPSHVDRHAIKLLSTLRNVHSLNLNECIFGNYSSPPIVALSWKKLGSNLRELDISARPQKVMDLLDSAPSLPRLEALKLAFERDPYYLVSESGMTGSRGAVSRFVRSLSQTLRELVVVEISRIRQLTLGFGLVSNLVLNSVGCLPKLERFLFDVGFNRDQPGRPAGGLMLRRLEEKFFGFLKANSSNLRHLSIPPIPLRVMPQQGDIGFPNRLESFTLLSSSPPTSVQDSVDATKTYLGNLAHTLTSLALRDQYLSVSELRDILSSLSPTYPSTRNVSGLESSTTCHLTNLSLQVTSLSPQAVTLLATELPHLKNLSLRLASLSSLCSSFDLGLALTQSSLPVRPPRLSEPITSCSDLLLFIEGMKELVYSQWELESVTLIGPWKSGIKEEKVLTAIGDALRKAVPGLQRVDILVGSMVLID